MLQRVPVDQEDAALVEAFKRGEDSAFTALVIKYRSTVYGIAGLMGANHEDGADVTQEVFIRAHRALPRFDGRSHLRTWLYRITVNLCLDYQERRNRHPWVDLEEITAEAAHRQGRSRAAAPATGDGHAAAVSRSALRGDRPHHGLLRGHGEGDDVRGPAETARAAGNGMEREALMQCLAARDALLEITTGRTPPDLRRAVAAHLADCPECRAVAGELEETAALLRAVPDPAPPEGFWPNFTLRLEERVRGPGTPGRSAQQQAEIQAT